MYILLTYCLGNRMMLESDQTIGQTLILMSVVSLIYGLREFPPPMDPGFSMGEHVSLD